MNYNKETFFSCLQFPKSLNYRGFISQGTTCVRISKSSNYRGFSVSLLGNFERNTEIRLI